MSFTLAQAIAAEFGHEAKITRRVLERVPDTKLAWQPHEKSMTLGRLTSHMAENPGWGSSIIEQDQVDMAAGDYKPLEVETTAEALAAFDTNVSTLLELLGRTDDAAMGAIWKMVQGEEVMFEAPRGSVLKSWMLNHMIHHRGQLAVYLRLLDVPIPSIYGPSADEADAGT